MADGWAISVRIQYMNESWSPPQIWYAAIANATDAVEVVKEVVGYTPDGMKVEAEAQISENIVNTLKIPPGKVMYWTSVAP